MCGTRHAKDGWCVSMERYGAVIACSVHFCFVLYRREDGTGQQAEDFRAWRNEDYLFICVLCIYRVDLNCKHRLYVQYLLPLT